MSRAQAWPVSTGCWAIPGTPGLEHRIGGLEKGDGHGNISYDSNNHEWLIASVGVDGKFLL